MKIPWGSPTVIRMRLIMVAVMVFVLAVLFWPQQKTIYFSLNPGESTAVVFTGKDFEYSLFVHSVDSSAKTAELSVFIPARSAYPETSSDSAAYGTFALSLEQNHAVTLKDFKEGQIYQFTEGSNGGPLFKLEHANDGTALFSVVGSWISDNRETQNLELTLNPTAPNESPAVATDKDKYAQGETVNISITNDTGSDIEICSKMFIIGRLNYSDDRIEWRQLMLGNAGYSANGTFTLHAGESIAASWNQTEQVWSSDWDVTNTIQVAPGQYRIEAISLLPGKDLEVIKASYAYSCYDIPPQLPLDESDYSVIIEIE